MRLIYYGDMSGLLWTTEMQSRSEPSVSVVTGK